MDTCHTISVMGQHTCVIDIPANNPRTQRGKSTLYHCQDHQATTTFLLLNRCCDVKITQYNMYNIGKGHVNVVRNYGENITRYVC